MIFIFVIYSFAYFFFYQPYEDIYIKIKPTIVRFSSIPIK